MRPPTLDDPFVRATVVNFFFFLSLNGFVLLPLYIQRLGGTEVEIGFVMGLYSGVGIVCQPLVGPWVDAIGRRPFMLLGPCLVVVSALLASVADSIGLLALVRALQGVGFSAFFVATMSYVIDLVPAARRGWALGIYGVAGLMATAIAPLGGEWIIRRLGFVPLFLLCAALAAVAGGFVLRLREVRAPGTQPGWGLETMRGSLADVFQRHMAVTLFFGLGTGTIFAFLPTFADSLGVHTLSLFYTAYAGAAMGVRVFGGRLIDTRGRRAVIIPSMFVQAAATALLASLGLFVTAASAVPVLPALFVAGLLAGGAHGFLYPGLAALVVDRTPGDRRAAAVGVFSAMSLIGQTTGAVAFGFAAHAVGYGLMWAMLTDLLLVGSLLSLRLEGGRGLESDREARARLERRTGRERPRARMHGHPPVEPAAAADAGVLDAEDALGDRSREGRRSARNGRGADLEG